MNQKYYAGKKTVSNKKKNMQKPDLGQTNQKRTHPKQSGTKQSNLRQEKQKQKNHVLYRITPYFEGNNELANGVNIEAYSIEDNGALHFNVYVYNVQDGIVIDYAQEKVN